jgi:CRP/FNR family transcriptional regulator, nitrogen oxide reductase regulator
MHDLLTRHPELAMNAIRDLEARLRDMEGRLRKMSSEPVEQRIAHALAWVIMKFGREVGKETELPFPLSRQDLADMTGATLYTVSRTLGVWEARGCIRRARRRVTVLDVAALSALSRDAAPTEVHPRRTHRRTPRRQV